jgi:hypothetical protein
MTTYRGDRICRSHFLAIKLLVDFQITPLETLGQFYNKAFLACFLIGYHYEFNGLGYFRYYAPDPSKCSF